MIYCVSDIHGEYEKWMELLEKISFSDCDTMFVLGDVVDRGKRPMKLLMDMMFRPNVIPLVGNHDLMAYYALRRIFERRDNKKQKDSDNDLKIRAWLADGGEPTRKAFQQLAREDQKSILKYLGEFSLYEVVRVGGCEYILVHGGLENFSENRPLDDYTPEEITFARTDYSKPLFSGNRYLVTGHTPTSYIEGHPNPGYIYRGNNHIAIDCGAVFWGGKLAALCLDTGEEFYVE